MNISEIESVTGISKQAINVLEGRRTLSEAVNVRRMELIEEQKEQNELLDFCDDLKTQSLEWINVDKYVDKIREKEKKGEKFFGMLEEYKQVFQGEWKKENYAVHC